MVVWRVSAIAAVLGSIGCGTGSYVLGSLGDDSEHGAWSHEAGEPSQEPDDTATGDGDEPPVFEPVAASVVFEPFERLAGLTGPIEYESSAAPRVCDWDRDGDLDVLVVLGSGEVVWHRNAAGPGLPWALEPAVGLHTLGGSPLGAGEVTAIDVVDDDGDAYPDLLALTGETLTVYRGTSDPSTLDMSTSVVPAWPDPARRFAALDYNADGRWDLLIAGPSVGLGVLVNTGVAGAPAFASVAELDLFEGSYNEYPAAIDLDADGRDDIVSLRASGSVRVSMTVAGSSTRPGERIALRHDDGYSIDLAALGALGHAPTVGDVDGDEVADLIVGTETGELWVAPGLATSSWLTTIRDLVDEHADDLGSWLAGSPNERDQLFGLHKAAREGLDGRFLAGASAEAIADHYAELIAAHPAWFCREHWDVTTEPYLPALAAQHTLILAAALPDTLDARQRIADVACLTGARARLFVDFGVLLSDNGLASTAQHDAIYGYLAAIPRHLWDVAWLYVLDWLGPHEGLGFPSSRASVWLNSIEVGTPENSFPADSPAAETDVFTITLVHLLNHHSLDRVGRRTHPDLFRRKFTLLAQASGADVVFHADLRRGVDWASTQDRFLSLGQWDGVEPWSDAWDRYFAAGDGRDLYYHTLRSNTALLIERPNYAFATLANQYFTDSEIMLALALDRWDRGYRTNINQFLHFVEYYADGGDEVSFCRMGVDAAISCWPVTLGRDAAGHISLIETAIGDFAFERDLDGDVASYAQVQ